MKKTNVKRHVRKTKKKIVPVRKHTRKNRGASFISRRADKILTEAIEHQNKVIREKGLKSPNLTLMNQRDMNKIISKFRAKDEDDFTDDEIHDRMSVSMSTMVKKDTKDKLRKALKKGENEED